jgi:hypothetical protein
MQLPWQSIEGFSGATAIESLVLIDLALISNAFADNLFPTINLYAQTPTWAIVVAVPLAALAYLLGTLSIAGGSAILARNSRFRVTAEEETSFLSTAPALVAARFQQLRQEAELLSGSFVAFVLLSVGSALHAVRLPGWRRFLTSVVIVALAFSALSIKLALLRYLLARSFAKVRKSERSTSAH